MTSIEERLISMIPAEVTWTVEHGYQLTDIAPRPKTFFISYAPHRHRRVQHRRGSPLLPHHLARRRAKDGQTRSSRGFAAFLLARGVHEEHRCGRLGGSRGTDAALSRKAGKGRRRLSDLSRQHDSSGV